MPRPDPAFCFSLIFPLILARDIAHRAEKFPRSSAENRDRRRREYRGRLASLSLKEEARTHLTAGAMCMGSFLHCGRVSCDYFNFVVACWPAALSQPGLCGRRPGGGNPRAQGQAEAARAARRRSGTQGAADRGAIARAPADDLQGARSRPVPTARSATRASRLPSAAGSISPTSTAPAISLPTPARSTTSSRSRRRRTTTLRNRASRRGRAGSRCWPKAMSIPRRVSQATAKSISRARRRPPIRSQPTRSTRACGR